MKKLFIGLLIIAAGAGAYYFLQKKKTKNSSTIQKELLAGNWKLNSLDVKTKDSSAYYKAVILSFDSNFYKYRYDFRKDGNVLKTVAASVKADTSRYEWTKKNEFTWKKNASDSIGDTFTVTKLSADSVLLLSKDSSTFLLTKLK